MNRALRITTASMLLMLACAACGGAARPYRAMAKAASSEEGVPAQVEDHRLEAQVRERLLEDGLGIAITPHVYMGHVYLVGYADSGARRDVAIQAARAVPGVRSVSAYVPTILRGASTRASDAALTAEIKAALALDGEVASRIDVEVLGGHAVLMGVLPSQEAIQTAVITARGVNGVTGVTSFLLLPESGYQRVRPGLC